MDERVCTCDPDFRPLLCQRLYAWSDCMKAERRGFLEVNQRLRAALSAAFPCIEMAIEESSHWSQKDHFHKILVQADEALRPADSAPGCSEKDA